MLQTASQDLFEHLRIGEKKGFVEEPLKQQYRFHIGTRHLKKGNNTQLFVFVVPGVFTIGFTSVWISSVHPCVAWHIFCLTALLLLNVVVFIANVALRITQ